MEIYFKTKRLAKICNNQKEAIKIHGTKMAAKLGQRMFELNAAKSLKDISRLPPARCHQLSGNRQNQFSVDLEHPFRLLFIPANEPLPRLPDGGFDLEKITEIEIIAIIDTH
ncbi:proteic killer suppression protein [Desulfosalsimonas propionicica]|uniref:Proteic killer suppression protein n=1 Tax=Desulfosalsimonas propionicica TaxID=332175 RepID=A0A7W0CCE5_9BACT|nr:killer suppression protein [Desulfosalsimonas propionicica]MBA2883165.1 proteic killer suppression protein [Desulfosalsimonas propionicica]